MQKKSHSPTEGADCEFHSILSHLSQTLLSIGDRASVISVRATPDKTVPTWPKKMLGECLIKNLQFLL